MLKIKDNVDLKELEKYGFKPITIVGQTKYQYVKRIGEHDLYNLKIANDRTMRFNITSVHNELPNVIYDLITADLVEKID